MFYGFFGVLRFFLLVTCVFIKYTEITSLLHKWLLRFLKPDSIDPRMPWTVDFANLDNWLPGQQFAMGDANAASVTMSVHQCHTSQLTVS